MPISRPFPKKLSPLHKKKGGYCAARKAPFPRAERHKRRHNTRHILRLDDHHQLHTGLRRIACCLGSGGKAKKQAEGDGITPEGLFPLRGVFYRPDRVVRPMANLPSWALSQRDGWCDDPGAGRRYNRFIYRPSAFRHEALWRKDALYDLAIIVGFNDEKVRVSLGSAIFIHNRATPPTPSAGCITMAAKDLRALIPLLQKGHLLLTRRFLLAGWAERCRHFSCNDKGFMLSPRKMRWLCS